MAGVRLCGGTFGYVAGRSAMWRDVRLYVEQTRGADAKKNRSAIFFGAHYFFLAAATQAYITRHGPSSDSGMSNKPVGQTPKKIAPRFFLAKTIFF